MEFTKIEMNAVRDIAENAEPVLIELNDLELMMIGGGTGDVHFG